MLHYSIFHLVFKQVFNAVAKSSEIRTAMQDTIARTNHAYVIQSRCLGGI
jgi:hypothetical protein